MPHASRVVCYFSRRWDRCVLVDIGGLSSFLREVSCDMNLSVCVDGLRNPSPR